MHTIPLCQLPKGKTGLIQGISCSSEKMEEKKALICRLLDLGFCQNTLIQGCFIIPGLILSAALSLLSETRMPR